MKKKIIVLGLGNHGKSWACEVVPLCADVAELVGTVDQRQETWEGLPQEVQPFKDLMDAVGVLKPDIVVNVTAPGAHTVLNKALMEKGIAVLCEKPISQNLEDAKEMLEYARNSQIPFMISENYRYKTVFRVCRKWIEEGKVGKVHSIRCQFSHFHPDYSMFYHGELKHPLLTDVTIHHLDLARYLSGQNAKKVFCKEWDAPYTWYGNRMANAAIWTEMTGGIIFEYSGSLAAAVSSTDWYGDWEIAGEQGTIRLHGDKLEYYGQEGQACRQMKVPSEYEDTRVLVLKEFIAAIKEGRSGETNIEDNYETQLWMETAIISAENKREERICR